MKYKNLLYEVAMKARSKAGIKNSKMKQQFVAEFDFYAGKLLDLRNTDLTRKFIIEMKAKWR